MREKTAQEIYDELSEKGEYKITEKNYDIIKKMRRIAIENSDYVNFLLKQKIINWRIIYTLYYDILRELCDALIRLNGIKISNHQGCFAYVCVKLSELELDWSFFETIRTIRNRNKYEGSDISKQDWKDIEIQTKLYVSTIKKELDKKLEKTVKQKNNGVYVSKKL